MKKTSGSVQAGDRMKSWESLKAGYTDMFCTCTDRCVEFMKVTLAFEQTEIIVRIIISCLH